MRYMFLLQNQKLAPHPTQSHVGESWHGGPALSRRISWRSCHRCGPRAVGPGSALGPPTPPRPVLATRLQALMRSMAPQKRIPCETWIYTWNRCIASEFLYLSVVKRALTKVLSNPIIQTGTRYFRHTYPPTHDTIIFIVLTSGW